MSKRSQESSSPGSPTAKASADKIIRVTPKNPGSTRDSLGKIKELREDAHLDMNEICGFIDAGSIAHGPELQKEFGIIQEF